MAKKRILIEVEVEEGDSLDPSYTYNPRVIFELNPIEPGIEGNMEIVCKRSEIQSKLAKYDRTGMQSSATASSRRIYDEPDEEASTLLEDAANNILGGLGTPVIKSIVEAIEDFVAPDRVRNKRR